MQSLQARNWRSDDHMNFTWFQAWFQARLQDHSTCLGDYLSLSVVKSRASLLLLLSLFAVFNTVNHDILLRQLEAKVGIKGSMLKSFVSYQTQRVAIGNQLSVQDLSCGFLHNAPLCIVILNLYVQPLRTNHSQLSG